MKIYKITDFSAIKEPVIDAKMRELTNDELPFFYISHAYFVAHDNLQLTDISGLELSEFKEDAALRKTILKSINDYEYEQEHLQPLLTILRTPEFSKHKETITASLKAFLLQHKFLISPLDEKQELNELYKYMKCQSILKKLAAGESITQTDTANFSMAFENSKLLIQEFSEKFVKNYDKTMRKFDLMDGLEDKLQTIIRDLEKTTKKDLEKSLDLNEKLQEMQNTLIRDLASLDTEAQK